jgi:acyl-coenzyme A thioesterase PaaI-like protein
MEKNFLASLVEKINNKPRWYRGWLLNYLIGSTIKFVGTAGVRCESLSREESVWTLKNRKKVRNHIKGIHAAAMGLLAETATGMVVGMNVPDDRIPVIKSMKINYLKRATGDLKAVAHLTGEQIMQIIEQEKGELLVPVTVTDSEGKEPIACEMIWAWTPKRR